jgi:hypothetical protein
MTADELEYKTPILVDPDPNGWSTKIEITKFVLIFELY